MAHLTTLVTSPIAPGVVDGYIHGNPLTIVSSWYDSLEVSALVAIKGCMIWGTSLLCWCMGTWDLGCWWVCLEALLVYRCPSNRVGDCWGCGPLSLLYVVKLLLHAVDLNGLLLPIRICGRNWA